MSDEEKHTPSLLPCRIVNGTVDFADSTLPWLCYVADPIGVVCRCQ